MIASDPEENGFIHANDCLVSPPRNWPDSFKSNKVLSAFLNKKLKASKARLTSAPPADIVAEAASLPKPSRADSSLNAERVQAACGWPLIHGFAVYELDEPANVFVARPHSWNSHPRNIWVDFTPRDAHHADVLLVQADVEAALVRAGLRKPPAAPPTPADVSDPAPAASSQAAS